MWILLDSDNWINLDYVDSIVRQPDGTAKAFIAQLTANEYHNLTARDMQRIHERLLNAEQR